MKKLLVKSIFEKFKQGGFTVQYWDGEEVTYGNKDPKVKIIFRQPIPLNINTEDPVMLMGEAFMDEIVDFEGSLEELFRAVELNKDNLALDGIGGKVGSAFMKLTSLNSGLKYRENIKHHYDLGNDFFSLWLDETMSYSCAYFRSSEDSLEKAQMQKIDHILKKLQLKQGERLLDIGCGWGWLLIRAAKYYDVQGLGVTLSEEQYSFIKQRINELGLKSQIEVKLISYHDLDEKEQFNKIVSVGMFEHVGKDNLAKYMDKVNKLLLPGGLSLLHTITKNSEQEINTWIEKYIFPGGYIPSWRETIWLLPEYNFHLLHAESLRVHYAMTLDRWHKNFCCHLDKLEERFGRRFVRMWDLYLRGCAASFRATSLNLHQFLFSKGLNNDLALTWEHVYDNEVRSQEAEVRIQNKRTG